MTDQQHNSDLEPRQGGALPAATQHAAVSGSTSAAVEGVPVAASVTRAVRCTEVESLAVLSACGELDAGERASLDAHVAACAPCAAVVAREMRLQQAIESFDQPADTLDRSGLLLAQCRSELSEALDDRRARAASGAWPSFLSPAAWWNGLRDTLIYHPAMSMAALLVAGFVAGVAGQRFSVPLPAGIATHTVMTAPSEADSQGAVRATRVTDEQLSRADRAHVALVTPAGSGSPTVQVEFNSPDPMNVVGAPNDADVERILKFFLENGQRFEPTVRMNSLDVLRMNAVDPGIRRTLCATARFDRDPNVRLKALDALQGYEQDPQVRATLLDALQSDANSSVRVEAIRLLLASLQSDGAAAGSDPQTAAVLRDRLHNDPSPSVRRQSAAALRALGEPAQ